ncbi:MAG: hypothetical protein ACRDJH_15025, partial [Thermomicrobiales bacterium]
MVQQMTGIEAQSAPTTWDLPLEAGGTWMPDPMHFPRPLSPLFQTVFGPAFARGFTTALQEARAPIAAVDVRFPNGYYFNRFEILQPADEEQARGMGEIAEGIGKREIGRLLERWEGEHLPAVLNGIDRLRAIEVERADGHERIALIDEVQQILAEGWLIHFRIVVPMMLAMGLYDDLYADLFGGDAADGHALLVGQLTKSVEAGIGLSDLAADARRAGLDRLILDTTAEDVLFELETTAAGRAFAARIRAYLDEFGLRQDLFDLVQPTWKEEPAIAIATLQAYLRAGHDARAEHERSVRSAEAATSAARAHLASYPAAVREQFEAILAAARAASFLQEQHNFFIDQVGLSLVRLFFLRLGRRFVAWNVIDVAEDIFLLTADEVKAIAAGPVGADRNVDVRAIVDERRLAGERAARLTPPAFLGEPPTAPPVEGPFDRALTKFFGGPPQVAEAPNQLKGNAGSRGVVRGVARVALTLQEAKALQ